MMNKTAIVFGATGLVGSELLNVLIRDVRYRAVKVFTRNELYIEHIKVIEKIVDVEDVDSYSDMLKGDDLYICLGTTRRKAGSVAKMEDIDRRLPVRIAKAALRMGVQNVALVSSIGARASSRNYYYRIKGRMEEDILELEFKRKVILRPSILLGKRSEFRLFESLGKSMVKALGFMLRGQREKYRGIKASIVAEAMVKELNNLNGKTIYESDEIADINSTIH
ncbi:MAG TPA: NAD(P)H-binding protein [Bacteroidales bacterium]|nr:NAD(P)H-binding protein [Bacteroidales bacterium]